MERSDSSALFGMPRNSGLLIDRSQRRIARWQKHGETRFPFPVPNGWFGVAENRELDRERILPLYVFGKDVVLFRTNTGDVHMIDAYCAHQGAHLGVGGKVEGECVRCPFHGWRYSGRSGQCDDIPDLGTSRIPSRARVHSYPVIERNHLIWAWHHAEGELPTFDVPTVPEFNDPDWLPCVIKTFDVETCCQEMMDNNLDFAHFVFVHGSPVVPDSEFEVSGPYTRTVGGGRVAEAYGMGLGILRIRDGIVFLSSVTPLDEEHVRVRWIFTAPRSRGDNAAKNAAETMAANVSQDLPIWENKRYVEHPIITRSERKMAEQRRWALQFYSNYPRTPGKSRERVVR